MAIVVGVQAMQFWAFANVHGMHEGLLPPDARVQRVIRMVTIERALITAAALLLVGLILGVLALSNWSNVAFGLLEPALTMRLAIPSATCVVLAFEIAFGGFVLNVLDLHENTREAVEATPSELSGARRV
jgi:hypothetical protein